MQFDTGSGKLYFEDSGQGKCLVLIHGGNLDCRQWDDQYPVLVRSYRTVRYDVRGHGRSDGVAQPYSDVEDLEGLLDHLGASSAVLIGSSLGSRIAVDFALERPDMVSGLVLAAPGLSGYAFTDSKVMTELAQAVKALTDGDFPRARSILADASYWKQDDPVIREKIARMMDGYNFSGWLRAGMILDARRRAIDHLHELSAPTLVVVGDQDVSDILRISELLEREIPGATRVVIPGTGHMLNMQKPSEFNQIVMDFLARL